MAKVATPAKSPGGEDHKRGAPTGPASSGLRLRTCLSRLCFARSSVLLGSEASGRCVSGKRNAGSCARRHA
eukprot:5916563-Alexandrium_andersonii.AAC.1